MTEKFKIYVVNLKNDLDRRKNIINEIEKQNIKNYEIIDAINGNELSEQELNTIRLEIINEIDYAWEKALNDPLVDKKSLLRNVFFENK